jgi:repressor LexA
MTDRPELTKRQREILEYIKAFVEKYSYPPSVRDIGEAVGLSSTSSVHAQLNNLEEKGYLRRDASQARALSVLLDDGETTVTENFEIARNIINLPVVGEVAAGKPITADENITEYLPMPKQFVGDTGSFMLTVRGDSMIEVGINDGDYVVVREQQVANNGEIVVALIDSEATVKTYYREEDRIRLQPENSSMEPIYVRDDVTILGRVIALMRRI